MPIKFLAMGFLSLVGAFLMVAFGMLASLREGQATSLYGFYRIPVQPVFWLVGLGLFATLYFLSR